MKRSLLAKSILIFLSACYVSPCLAIGDLCGLATRNGTGTITRSEILQAYLGVIEDSKTLLTPSSLQHAVSSRNPFALEGDGPLFELTQGALVLVKKLVDGLPKKQRMVLRRQLLKELKKLLPPAPGTLQRARASIAFMEPGTNISLFPSPWRRERLVAVGYSPDGRFVVSVSESGQVHTYLRLAGELERVHLTEPLVPDGRATHHITREFTPYPYAFSPDGSLFAFIGRFSGEHSGPFVMDLQTGAVIRNFRDAVPVDSNDRLSQRAHGLSRLLFSPDGSHLAAAARKDGGSYRPSEILWNIQTNFAPVRVQAFYENGNSLGFSPDGRFCFITARGLHIYDTTLGAELISPQVFDDYKSDGDERPAAYSTVAEAAVHPRKKWIAIQHQKDDEIPDGGGAANVSSMKVSILDYSSIEKHYAGKERFYDFMGVADVQLADLSRIRPRLLNDRKPRNWNSIHPGGLIFSPDGKFLVSSFYNSIEHLNTLDVFAMGETIQRVRSPLYRLGNKVLFQAKKMEFTHDSRYFVVLDYEKVNIFSVPEFERVGTILPWDDVRGHIADFSISPDLKEIVVLEDDGTARQFNFFGTLPFQNPEKGN